MLYERWRDIAQQFRNEIALVDAGTGERWTFAELASVGEKESDRTEALSFPQGNTPAFIFNVLRGWRFRKPICPLELGQTPPSFPTLPDDCLHLKLTSGSTGSSRAVAFTGNQLAADAANIVATMGLRREWPNLGAISLAHSYGFSNLVLPLLLHGIPLILVPAPLPEIVRRSISENESVTISAVPALWRIWHDADVLLPNVRLAISAGAPLPLALERGVFEKSALKIHNFYGSSECGGIAFDRSNVPRTDAAWTGEPMNNVLLTVGHDGCLEVRSEAVGETYWPEANERLSRGVFRTSDLAEIVDGQVFLRGRATDQINVAGRKISPETIERALAKHPLVRECLVFGVPSTDVERTETIVACVAGQGAGSPEELRQFLLTELPGWQVPREWWFVDALTTNERGKLPRAEWRKRYLAR